MPVDISREPAASPGVLTLFPFHRSIAFVIGFGGVWLVLALASQLLI
ncbi:hypothetical protein [Devosia nitrariae]|nr:hypothetical protein [Devosia nitrariae]